MAEKKQTVWRVQNEFGSGPFRGRGNVYEALVAIQKAGRLSGTGEGRRPVPQKDETLMRKFNTVVAEPNDKFVCGFKNIEQYQRWFSTREIRDLLHYAGFFLAKYEVDGPVSHGQTQSLFSATKAKLVAVRACNQSGVTPPAAIKVKAATRFLRAQKKERLEIKAPRV